MALVALLAAAYLHPRGRVEALLALGCSAVVLATGTLDATEVRRELERLLPVVLFLMAILVVAECCRGAGLFGAVGTRLARAGSHQRIFALAFVVATATTVVLSLDATVVLLTPVVLASAAATHVTARPLQLVCVRLANSASLLLPVSNLTNLLAMPRLDVGFGRFALLMAPVWVLTLLIEYAAHRLWFRDDLRQASSGRDAPSPLPLPTVPLVVVAAMLAGFAAGSLVGVDPAWVAGGAAAVLAVRARRHREVSWGRLARSTHASFALFVLALGLVVATLGRGPLGDLLGAVLPDSTGLLALLGTALVGAVLANLVNNLPATLLIVPLVAPLGTTPALAALIGVNLGSSMTWSGSLANLLWRRSVGHHGGTVSSRDFHAVALLATPVAVVAGVTILDLWARLV
ncbi:arsenic transporter [Nocardioides pocheonensis]|uniref:Arsenic transporter n=1 Tax=Nocardioides pocheonensis TaxID=661485 RepID=A0A3N0GL71_9ACTN|nr:arsenic transporter [Nocardioides pocheonensis]